MSLRNRIVVAGLLLTLVAPVTGLALSSGELDPDGRSLVTTGMADPDLPAPGELEASRLDRTEMKSTQSFETGANFESFLGGFLSWLRAMVQLP